MLKYIFLLHWVLRKEVDFFRCFSKNPLGTNVEKCVADV